MASCTPLALTALAVLLSAAFFLGGPAAAAAGDAAGPPRPDPAHTPMRVLAFQLQGLVEAADPGAPADAGMRTVWAFACPANQAQTGPFENFDAMVRTGYAVLVGHREASVLELVPPEGERPDACVVLLRVLGADGRRAWFVWHLTRETQGELAGCWMTAAVVPAEEPGGDAADGGEVI